MKRYPLYVGDTVTLFVWYPRLNGAATVGAAPWVKEWCDDNFGYIPELINLYFYFAREEDITLFKLKFAEYFMYD